MDKKRLAKWGSLFFFLFTHRRTRRLLFSWLGIPIGIYLVWRYLL